MIPAKIHFVWVGPPMPDWAKRNIEEFRRLNPEHKIIVHGRDAMAPDFERLVRPDMDPCEIADLIRLSVLESSGGWYFDCDYWPMRPVADIERAYALTGEEIFTAEVWASHQDPGWMGNGVIAVKAGHPLLARLREMSLAAVPDGRLTYGPRLFRTLYDADPSRFIVAPEPWFNGPKPEWSSRLYRAIMSRGNSDIMLGFDPRTGGQKPYAMHLWAWKYGQDDAAALKKGIDPVLLINPKVEVAPRARLGTYGRGNARHAAVLTLPGYSFGMKGSLFTGIGQGLASLGFEVDMLALDTKALMACRNIPEVLVVWNGLREPTVAIVAEARRLGAKILFMEMGFWERKIYTQVDCRGTQHRASWAGRLCSPAPEDGAERLARFYPSGIIPMHAKKGGYVLVIGQVPLDTQLADSEIQGPLPLQKAVKGAIPAGVQVYFRPHPQCSNVTVPGNKLVLPIFGASNDAVAYREKKVGPGLAEALAGARFVVLINSTAGNEALAAGVPVLALGPALYLAAGVARKATLETFSVDIKAMLDGWAPEQAKVDNYLRWLAARQWTEAEFSEGKALRVLLSEVGIRLSEPEPLPAEIPAKAPEWPSPVEVRKAREAFQEAIA